jgi:aerobic-type carbon monoxide dehydrogenase small subunit (CoxS/CutS family)
MIDGKAQVSCQYPVSRAEGKEITTLEGVDEDERTRYSDAFAACGGLQ